MTPAHTPKSNLFDHEANNRYLQGEIYASRNPKFGFCVRYAVRVRVDTRNTPETGIEKHATIDTDIAPNIECAVELS
jgi:hypothetical protein